MQHHWEREQLLIAFKLYCELPFGKLHSKNPEIIKYAEKIGRTPSALAMKLGNIASLDPVITVSGRKGLSGASKVDKEMWQEMTSDWEVFSKQIIIAEEKLGLEQPKQELEEASYQGYTKQVQIQARVGQAFFRKCVLSAYDYKCCISGLSVPQLLIASHIVPWNKDEHNRLNPHNGLCLSVLHDKAFDIGLISINSDYTVATSPILKKYSDDSFLKAGISGCENKPLLLPEKFQPDQTFLKYHRENIFVAA